MGDFKTPPNRQRTSILNLLTPVGRQSVVEVPTTTSKQVFRESGLQTTATVKKGKHGSVVFGTEEENDTSPFVVIKSEAIDPTESLSRPIREYLILRELQKIDMSQYYSSERWNGFVKMRSSHKVAEDDEDMMLLVLERADETLSELFKQHIHFYDARDILFQILFALHIAGVHLEFVHNDLHSKNIMYRYKRRGRDPETVEMTLPVDDELISFYSMSSYMVKICDFGLSKIKTSNGLEMGVLDSRGSIITAVNDLAQLHYELGKWKIDWESLGDDANHYKKQWRDMRTKMSNGGLIQPLLLHPLFSEMTNPLPMEELELPSSPYREPKQVTKTELADLTSQLANLNLSPKKAQPKKKPVRRTKTSPEPILVLDSDSDTEEDPTQLRRSARLSKKTSQL